MQLLCVNIKGFHVVSRFFQQCRKPHPPPPAPRIHPAPKPLPPHHHPRYPPTLLPSSLIVIFIWVMKLMAIHSYMRRFGVDKDKAGGAERFVSSSAIGVNCSQVGQVDALGAKMKTAQVVCVSVVGPLQTKLGRGPAVQT